MIIIIITVMIMTTHIAIRTTTTTTTKLCIAPLRALRGGLGRAGAVHVSGV